MTTETTHRYGVIGFEFVILLFLLWTTMSKYWEQENTDGDVFYDLWKKFWGKPLDFEDVTIASVDDNEDDEERMKSFKVLTIGAGFDHLLLTKGRLIVRQEYLDAVVSLNKRNNERGNTGAIVIGHPGIGKSWFLYYLLVLRLSEQKKTIFNLDPASYIRLFDSSGCYRFRGEYLDDLSGMARDAWALLDVPTNTVNPHPFLTSPLSPVFMVFACSPNDNRYKDYKKQKRAMYYTMDNWTFDEIWAGATLRSAGSVDQKTLYDYFTKYGPSARTMYELYDGETTPEWLDENINLAFENISVKRLQRLVYEAKGYLQGSTNAQGLSHSIILSSPNRNDRSMLHGEIITHYVFQRLVEKMFQNDILALIQTYKIFSNAGHTELGVTCGWIFEHYCHYMLSEHEGRQLELIPLEAKKTTQREIKGEKVPFKTCRPKPQVSESDLTDFTITKREPCFFGDEDIFTFSDVKYFRPYKKNTPTYDGLMTKGDLAFAFQMTVSSKHDVAKSGIDDLGTRLGNRPLNYILLVPKDIKGGDEKHLDMRETIYDGRNRKFYMALVDIRPTAKPMDGG